MRAHFAIFIPNGEDIEKDPNDREAKCTGHQIHVTGEPFNGYYLEFKRNHSVGAERDLEKAVLIGHVESKYVVDTEDRKFVPNQRVLGTLDTVAASIPAPGPNEDVRAPVNDICGCDITCTPSGLTIFQRTNRRCQEWTMEFVRTLTGPQFRYLYESASATVQAERDEPTHGIVGLRQNYQMASDESTVVSM
jgi:hypothetical protein